MPKTEQEIIIAAPIGRVFEAITDYESYPEFLPDMKHVRVASRHDGVTIATFELEIIMRISYTLRLVEDSPHTVSWALESAKMIQANDGGWQLEETEDGQTRARYGLEVKLRGLIPKTVSARLIGETLPETLQRFKDRIEGLSG